MVDKEFDFVVVGGGSSGCVVAARLAEDAGVTVGLVEAGPSDEHREELKSVSRWIEMHPQYERGYVMEPQERGNPRIYARRARVLGGCGSHNGCWAWRAPDYDMQMWVRAGAAGWGPKETELYFERVLKKVGLEHATSDNDAAAAFVTACVEAGFLERVWNADGSRTGVGWAPLSAHAGLRRSSSVAYLHPLDALSPNLTVLTDTEAQRLLFDEEGGACGVETSRGLVRAAQETIVCCGAYDSPKLLMLSGIGPASALREFGLKVRADLPVGRHLIDHSETGVVYEANRLLHQPNTTWVDACLLAKVETLEHGPPDVLLFFNSRSELMVEFDPAVTHAESRVFSLGSEVAHPRSEGQVTLHSSDPADPPRVDPAYFTDADGYDERLMVAGIRLARHIASQPALQSWIRTELEPGAGVECEEELVEYARSRTHTADHPAGTCRMGASHDPRSVVDPQLRVRGVGRLRVADASVFPTIIGVNPNITCMMIGEKCSDLLRADWHSPLAHRAARPC